jgi:flagellar hook assembly protein FlgD
VRLEVLDIFGHTVKTLTDGMMQTGLHKSEWDNATVTGERAKPGIYFYRLKTSNNVITKKLIIN